MHHRTPLTLVIGPRGGDRPEFIRALLQHLHGPVEVLDNQPGEGAELARTERCVALDAGCCCCDGFEQLAEQLRAARARGSGWLVLNAAWRAQPADLVLRLAERLPEVRLDAVIAVLPAEHLRRGPDNGEPVLQQILESDLVVVSNASVLAPQQAIQMERQLHRINSQAVVLFADEGSGVDPRLALGIGLEQTAARQAEAGGDPLSTYRFASERALEPARFGWVMDRLGARVCRAAGVVCLAGEGSFRLSCVAGRWELDPLPEHAGAAATEIVLACREQAPAPPPPALLRGCELCAGVVMLGAPAAVAGADG